MLNNEPSTNEATNTNPYSDKTVQLLSQGLLQIYEPSLVKVKRQLAELTSKQNSLTERLHNENLEIARFKDSHELLEMINKIKLYHSKLVNIKRDMKLLYEKSAKLKKRALKLEQHVEKEAYIKNQQKEIQLKMEQDLIASKAHDL